RSHQAQLTSGVTASPATPGPRTLPPTGRFEAEGERPEAVAAAKPGQLEAGPEDADGGRGAPSPGPGGVHSGLGRLTPGTAAMGVEPAREASRSVRESHLHRLASPEYCPIWSVPDSRGG